MYMRHRLRPKSLYHQRNMAAETIATTGLILKAFSATINGVRYIKLAKDFTVDFQANMVSLRNAELRVSRWGATVGLTGDEKEDRESLEAYLTRERDRNGAIVTLNSIRSLTTKVTEKSGHLVNGEYLQRPNTFLVVQQD